METVGVLLYSDFCTQNNLSNKLPWLFNVMTQFQLTMGKGVEMLNRAQELSTAANLNIKVLLNFDLSHFKVNQLKPTQLILSLSPGKCITD